MSFRPIKVLSVFAAGTVYTLTNTSQLVTFGTTSPSLTLTSRGTYALHGFVRVDFNAATFSAPRNFTVLLRRTNNTPANLTNSGTVFVVPIVTTLTNTMAMVPMKELFYTTTNADDVIELWADISTLPDAGSLQVVTASLAAILVS